MRALRLNNIHVVIVSRKKLNSVEELEQSVPWEFPSFSPAESLAFMLITHKNWIFSVETDISNLTESQVIKDCGGEPTKLRDRAPAFITNVLNYRDKKRKSRQLEREIEELDDDDEEDDDDDEEDEDASGDSLVFENLKENEASSSLNGSISARGSKKTLRSHDKKRLKNTTSSKK